LGWTLDAFDFTVFLLIMSPIAQEFNVPLIDVTAIFSITLVMRLFGATISGWMADRMGRRAPLMISILWYSVCNFSGRALSQFFVLVRCPRAARHRDGCRMAGRRSPCDGDLACAKQIISMK
jgi:MFS transporter, SHS family, lactate transporter